MDLNLNGKVALISGGSRGIGLAIARALWAEGCCLALAARNARDLDLAAASLGTRTSTHLADVTDPDACERLVAAVRGRWGHVDVAICNAGSGTSVAPGMETADEWRRLLTSNLLAATNIIGAVRPVMKQRNGGAIVCISSICGLAALGAPVTYSAAKAALNAAVRGLARPLAAEGIRINAIAPGNILTAEGVWSRKVSADREGVEKMLAAEVSQRRLGGPQEIADVAAFLASDRASFITGAIVVVDGGQLRG